MKTIMCTFQLELLLLIEGGKPIKKYLGVFLGEIPDANTDNLL